MKAILISAFFAVSACLLSVGAFAGPLEEEIKKRQEGVHTVTARFTQEKHTAFLGRPIKSAGSFYFKSPVGVRWQYDDAMEVVYDGRTLYLYYAETKEAEKVSGAGGFVGPLVFDMGELLKGYDVRAGKEDGDITLFLKPLKRMPFAAMQMTFRGDAAFPHEITVVEEGGDKTVIRFNEIKTNQPLKDSLFKFKPPAGVTVRERELGR